MGLSFIAQGWSLDQGLALFAVAVALVGVTAFVTARLLRFDGLVVVPAMYVIGFAEIVAISLVCSIVRVPLRPLTYLLPEAAIALAVIAVASRRPRESRLSWHVDLPSPRGWRSSPLVWMLGAVVGLGLVYELALAAFTTANNFDSLWHHLARAAFWHQQGRVSFVPHVNIDVINIYPPNPEVLTLFGFTFLHADSAAALSQYVAQGVLLVSVGATARRLGYNRAAATFAALVTATFPLVALQSVTTQVDLTLATLISATALFLLRGGTWDIRLAAVAFGLALGTKYTALLVIPTLVLLLLATGSRGRRLVGALSTLTVGALVFGSFGYVQNVLHSGRLFGAADATQGLTAPGSLLARPRTVLWIAYGFSDISGAQGLQILVYLSFVVAAVAFSFLVVTRRGRGLSLALRAALLALAAPYAVVVLSELAGAALRAAGASHVPGASVRDLTPVHITDEDFSWFGPLGALLIVPLAFGITARDAIRRHLRPATALASALPLFTAGVAATLAYNPFVGRFFLVPVVLVAPLLAGIYHRPALAIAASATGAFVLACCLAVDATKPSGIDTTGSVWRESRLEQQTAFVPDLLPVLRRVQRIPRGDTIVLQILAGDPSYPFFGAKLQHHVEFAAPHTVVKPGGHLWLVTHNRTGGWRLTG